MERLQRVANTLESHAFYSALRTAHAVAVEAVAVFHNFSVPRDLRARTYTGTAGHLGSSPKSWRKSRSR